MPITRRPVRIARASAFGLLAALLTLSLAGTPSSADEDATTPSASTPGTPSPTDTDSTESEPTDDQSADEPSADEESREGASTQRSATAQSHAVPNGSPFGAAYPVSVEANFARPYRSISSQYNSDFTQLEDLERLIKGSYWDMANNKLRPWDERRNNFVYITVSRMENSYRVGRYLKLAASHGVKIRFIHGVASQSNESRALQSSLNSGRYRDSKFRICSKGKSKACLSTISGAIMHSKILVIGSTYTRDKKPARGAVWTGSANLGGPSGERTYNNGLTVYNDEKMYYQFVRLFEDMYAERSVGNDMINFLKKNQNRYGYTLAENDGYPSRGSKYGMFYSPMSNVTVYPTPIAATPTNGKDPVMNLLNRVKPDSQCRIRLQQNRFKYRRIGVAEKLTELANGGCKISGVYFEDDLAVNRSMHCQQYIRVCRPILDVFRRANRRIEAAYAKPHDKTILVDALLRKNQLNKEEIAVDGTRYSNWGSGSGGVVRTRLVQAGSAALTGSNLIASDEVTTETTDIDVYEQYLDHWKAILESYEYKSYPY